MKTTVLIVGGGPVGLTLAMDLAWRGIDVVVAERRPPNDPPNVKCGQIGARSMEIFQRLGVADKLRGIGLPADYPNDIVSATASPASSSPAYSSRRAARVGGLPQPGRTLSGRRPSTRTAATRSSSSQCCLRTLRSSRSSPSAHRDHGPRSERAGVTASAVDLNCGTRSTIECDYLVGCDGAARLCANQSAPSLLAYRSCSTHNRSTSRRRSSGACCPASRPGSTSRSIRADAA